MSLDLSCDELMVMGLRPCGGGKSAYTYAVEGGYTGTEEEFGLRLAVLLNGEITATVDTDTNRITLSGALTPGTTYTAYYELTNSDGTKNLLEIGELTLDEETEPTIYTVTFVADGAAVSTKTYTVENPVVEEPAIPVKEGYTGVWETYDLTKGGDITVNAVYTAIEVEPAEPKNFANPSDEYWWNDAYMSSAMEKRDAAGYVVTNYISVEVGDVVEITGLDFTGETAQYRSAPCKADKTLHGSYGTGALKNMTSCQTNGTFTETGATFTHNNSAVSYWRFGGKLVGSANDIVIHIKRNGEYLTE